MTDLAIPAELLHRRINHLKGALTIAIALFTDTERRESPAYQWLKETLREPIETKVIDLTMAKEPGMAATALPQLVEGLDHKGLPS